MPTRLGGRMVRRAAREGLTSLAVPNLSSSLHAEEAV